MHKPRLFLLALITCLFLADSPILAAPAAQTLPGTITLAVEAGFGGHFRENEWLPVIVRASNQGEDVSGRLLVRPETSANAVTNTFSTPITLPSGGQQTVFLYVTARSFATQLRVELIDDSGLVVAAQPATVHAIQQPDGLYVVFTASAVGSVDLTGAHLGDHEAFQANWSVSDLPDRAAALDSVDLMFFSDVDSGIMSTSQRQSLADWIANGGHLIVTGGPNWQGTAAGLSDLLPLQPTGSMTVDTIAPLAEWLSLPETEIRSLETQTVISTGTLAPDAQTLVLAADSTPLLARRTFGEGTVDYLAVDPNTQPLRGWGNLPNLWFTLLTTTRATPGWSQGFGNWEQAGQAVEVLPGFDPLPDVLPLCGFLFAYIALIGPINYFLLSRINRREWAWITIPALILVFSIASWVFGINLRGNEATLNRLAVVQAWPDTDRARLDGLIGLLSPRRTQYTLTVEDGQTLRPIPRPQLVGNALTGSAQTSIDIRQAEQFRADQFTIDASFIAGFNLSGMMVKPAVSGSASIADDLTTSGQQIVQGSIRNDSDTQLNDPVILARGQSLHLGSPLQPGDTASFDLTLPGEGLPSPSPYVPGATLPYLASRLSFATNAAEQSVIDILGSENYDMTLIRRGANAESVDEQTILRQQWFLSALVHDSFQSTGRGDKVYLAGWVDESPLSFELSGASWNAQSVTIYLIELATEVSWPTAVVTIPPERFTWAVRAYNGVSEVAPIDLNMQPGEETVFRFTPLPDAVLDEVTELWIHVSDLNVGAREVPLYLWDWNAETWELYAVTRDGLSINDHARFLGPQNAVEVRLAADDVGGYMRVGEISIEEVGTFNPQS